MASVNATTIRRSMATDGTPKGSSSNPPAMSAGAALFRGALPPRPETLQGVERAGITLTPMPGREGFHWSMRAVHPAWGACEIACLRNPRRVPDLLLKHDARLTDDEKQAVRLGQSAVAVRYDVVDRNVLRERKKLLRFLHAVSGGDAVAVVDHSAQTFWSPVALDEELAHDADLDILSIFTAHAISDGDAPAHWVHTHGLAEIGFFDVDVVGASPALQGAWEVMRSIAFSVVEGRIAVGADGVSIVGGLPPMHMIDARSFLGKSAKRHPGWSRSVDDEHLDNHAIICDPPTKGFLGLFGGEPRPWSGFALPSLEGRPVRFSDAATEVMAARARATLPLFGALCEEFADLELPAIVKLRYEVRGPSRGAEHLWFEVNTLTDKFIDATLMNKPFEDIGMNAGDRRRHDLDRLSDWTMITPLGQISPRSLNKARALREKKDEILSFLREKGEAKGARG